MIICAQDPKRSLRSNARRDLASLGVFFGIALYLVLSLFASTNRAHAQSTVNGALCDAQIMNNSDDVFGYRFRGDRCEGRYQQPTAAPPPDLTIVSFAWSKSWVCPGRLLEAHARLVERERFARVDSN
jgi:hypothetical protein